MNTLVICRRINYIERKYTTSKVAGALNKKVNKNKKPHKGLVKMQEAHHSQSILSKNNRRHVNCMWHSNLIFRKKRPQRHNFSHEKQSKVPFWLGLIAQLWQFSNHCF